MMVSGAAEDDAATMAYTGGAALNEPQCYIMNACGNYDGGHVLPYYTRPFTCPGEGGAGARGGRGGGGGGGGTGEGCIVYGVVVWCFDAVVD